MNQPELSFIWAIVLCLAFTQVSATGVALPNSHSIARQSQQPNLSKVESRNRHVATTFAPIFYQALGENPRGDYITNFDFDGDWQGDDNWAHAEDDRFPLKAFVYYSVAETASHFFIHYALFHPRDYKGGTTKGAILSALIREGAKRGGKYDPTGLAEETALAHENDMEGCLVVVAKDERQPEQGKVVFVETLHHNSFSRYVAANESHVNAKIVKLEGQRPLLYVEPKGHGIHALGDSNQTAKKNVLVYKFSGKAEEPATALEGNVGYDLLSLDMLWTKARVIENGKSSLTYGEFYDYNSVNIDFVQPDGRVAKLSFDLGKIGSAFLGKVGGLNMARPPWGWFDVNNRNEPLGVWFFDPAKAVKRDFLLDSSFSSGYVQLPFWTNGISAPKMVASPVGP